MTRGKSLIGHSLATRHSYVLDGHKALLLLTPILGNTSGVKELGSRSR